MLSSQLKENSNVQTRYLILHFIYLYSLNFNTSFQRLFFKCKISKDRKFKHQFMYSDND